MQYCGPLSFSLPAEQPGREAVARPKLGATAPTPRRARQPRRCSTATVSWVRSRSNGCMALRCLTFEVSRRRRWDARPGLAKMYRVPPARAWWPAVGAPLDRGVRQRCSRGVVAVGPPRPCNSCWPAACASRSALTAVACHVLTAARRTQGQVRRRWTRRPHELSEQQSLQRSAVVRCGSAAPCLSRCRPSSQDARP